MSRAVLGWGAVPYLGGLLLFAAMGWPHPLSVDAASPDQDHVLAEIRQRIETSDYRASGALTGIDGQGHRTSSKFNVKGHWFPDGFRLLVETSGPAGAPSRILLHMNVHGHVTIDVLLPGRNVATALPYERWNEGLLGTDLSYEDLLDSQFFWKSQEFLAPEEYASHSCFVVKSVVDSGDRSHYSSVTSWIDRETSMPVHLVKAIQSTGQRKEFTYFGFRRSGSAWSATHLEVRMQGGKSTSLFVIERGSDKAKLTLKDFAPGSSVTNDR